MGSAIPTVNITLSLSTNVTSRLLPGSGASNASEAIMLIDEPGSGLPPAVPGFGPAAPQILCPFPTVGASSSGCVEFARNVSVGGVAIQVAAASASGAPTPGSNVFQGIVSANQVTFFGVPILPPMGGASRIFRFTNIRANASALGGGSASGSTQLMSSISVSGSISVPINNPVQVAAFVQSSLSPSVRNPANTGLLSGNGTSLGQCAGSNNPIPVSVLQFSENFGAAFKTRVVPTSSYNGQASTPSQNVPGTVYNSESGFVVPIPGSTPAGLADYGTRLRAVFNSVPAGVRIFVSVTNLAANTSSPNTPLPSGASTSSYALLLQGESSLDGNGSTPSVPPTTGVNGTPPTTGLTELTVANGSATAVWEVVNTNPAAIEGFLFGVWTQFGSATPALGVATVNLNSSPAPPVFSAAAGSAASSSLPVSRFIDTSVAGNVFSTVACQPSSTAITVAPTTVAFGGALTVTATVSPSGAVGSVTFKDGAATLNTIPLASGAAILTTAALSVGIHSLSAVYSGDATHNGSTSQTANEVVTKAATNTAISASPSSATFGQPVVLTATVTPPAATGTMTFQEGSAVLGTAPVSGGSASITVSNFPVGNHVVAASYGGDGNFATSNAAAIPVGVAKGPTTTGLSALPTSAGFGQPVVLTAAVTPSAATGTVTFQEGSAVLGSAPVASGSASITVSSFSAGNHVVTATYGGDGNYTASNATGINVGVGKTQTTASLSALPTSAGIGQPVVLTATVTPPAATGTVTFQEGSTLLGSAPVATGSASVTVSSLSAGNHVITASYGGDGNYTASNATGINVGVGKVQTTTSLSALPNPAIFGQAVNLSATVTPAGATGNIIFTDGSVTITTIPLSNGSASFAASALAVGSHSIAAAYGGDANSLASTSPTVTEVVNKVPSTTTLTASPASASPGQTVTLTATLNPPAATGTVTFNEGAATLGSTGLVNGSAAIPIANLAAGSHTLTAVYSGDSNTAASTSLPATVNVGGLSISSLYPSSTTAGSAGFTLTVNGAGFVTGAVVQWNGTTLNTTFVSATQLTATVTQGLVASAGTAAVTVIEGNANAGASFSINPPSQPCSFTLTAFSASLPMGGGAGSVSVTASRSDCAWTANSGANWIALTGNAFTGTGTLNYNVVANPSGLSRTGSIAINGQTFTVRQAGTTCTYSLPFASQAFSFAAGSGTASVQAPFGCAWNASSAVPWIAIAPPAGGSGSGAVSFSVAANPSTAARFATLTIANLSYNVTQAGNGSSLGCTAGVASVPQLAIEGLTEAAGSFVISCSGFGAASKADITLTLNTTVTNPLNGGLNPVLTVNGGSGLSGTITGNNVIRFAGVSLTPTASGAVNMTISQVYVNANQLAATSNVRPIPIVGQVSIGALVAVPVIGAQQTMANAGTSLIFTRQQASPPTGGTLTFVPVVFQEANAGSFRASATRLRVALTNVPGTVTLLAPVFPSEGNTRAQLYSADANGQGGSPVAGALQSGGIYQQLTVNGGAATATWLVTGADGAQPESWTFPLLIQNATAGDLNQIQVSGCLAPVSTVGVASLNAPVPRYRDASTPQKLVNLRMRSSVQVQPAGAAATARAPDAYSSNLATASAIPASQDAATVAVGSKVTFTHDLVNDTADADQTATNVTITNNLPSGLTLVSCAASGAACGGAGNQVQVTYSSLAPGQGATITVVAQVDPSLANGTVVENPVDAGSDDPNADVFAASASTSFVVLAGTPVVVGGTPPAGAGDTQTFVYQFSHPAGFQNLGVLNILINNALDGRSACYLAYAVQPATLFLVNDAGEAGGPYAGTAVLGSGSAIENGQCRVTLVSAQGNGPTLTLTLSITFKSGFAGNKVVYVAARDQAQGNSDWQALGVWRVPFTSPGSIAVGGVDPPRGAGMNRQFTFTLTDTKGTGDFGVVNVLMNNAIDGRKACYLAYAAATNILYLVNDAGDAGGPYAGSIQINGSNTGIENGACSVNGSGSAVSSAANTLTLTLNIAFKPAFAGNRVLYVAGRDRSEGNNTNWQAMGTWTVQ